MNKKWHFLFAFIRWQNRRRGSKHTVNSEVHHALTGAAGIFQEVGELSDLPEVRRCFEIVPDASVGNRDQPRSPSSNHRISSVPHTVMNLTIPQHVT